MFCTLLSLEVSPASAASLAIFVSKGGVRAWEECGGDVIRIWDGNGSGCLPGTFRT